MKTKNIDNKNLKVKEYVEFVSEALDQLGIPLSKWDIEMCYAVSSCGNNQSLLDEFLNDPSEGPNKKGLLKSDFFKIKFHQVEEMTTQFKKSPYFNFITDYCCIKGEKIRPFVTGIFHEYHDGNIEKGVVVLLWLIEL